MQIQLAAESAANLLQLLDSSCILTNPSTHDLFVRKLLAIMVHNAGSGAENVDTTDTSPCAGAICIASTVMHVLAQICTNMQMLSRGSSSFSSLVIEKVVPTDYLTPLSESGRYTEYGGDQSDCCAKWGNEGFVLPEISNTALYSYAVDCIETALQACLSLLVTPDSPNGANATGKIKTKGTGTDVDWVLIKLHVFAQSVMMSLSLNCDRLLCDTYEYPPDVALSSSKKSILSSTANSSPNKYVPQHMLSVVSTTSTAVPVTEAHDQNSQDASTTAHKHPYLENLVSLQYPDSTMGVFEDDCPNKTVNRAVLPTVAALKSRARKFILIDDLQTFDRMIIILQHTLARAAGPNRSSANESTAVIGVATRSRWLMSYRSKLACVALSVCGDAYVIDVAALSASCTVAAAATSGSGSSSDSNPLFMHACQRLNNVVFSNAAVCKVMHASEDIAPTGGWSNASNSRGSACGSITAALSSVLLHLMRDLGCYTVNAFDVLTGCRLLQMGGATNCCLSAVDAFSEGVAADYLTHVYEQYRRKSNGLLSADSAIVRQEAFQLPQQAESPTVPMALAADLTLSIFGQLAFMPSMG